MDEPLESKTLLRLNMLLNNALCGLSADEITLGLVQEIKQQAGEHSEIAQHVIEAAAEAIHSDTKPRIYTSGADKILEYPELAEDNAKAGRLIGDFEEKKNLASIVQEALDSDDQDGDIQVYIGNEMPMASMQNCSVVTATYDLGGGMKGTIGVIGPKRMDYDRVIGVMKQIMRQLDELYKK